MTSRYTCFTDSFHHIPYFPAYLYHKSNTFSNTIRHQQQFWDKELKNYSELFYHEVREGHADKG